MTVPFWPPGTVITVEEGKSATGNLFQNGPLAPFGPDYYISTYSVAGTAAV